VTRATVPNGVTMRPVRRFRSSVVGSYAVSFWDAPIGWVARDGRGWSALVGFASHVVDETATVPRDPARGGFDTYPTRAAAVTALVARHRKGSA
jgi:hypothetical protein